MAAEREVRVKLIADVDDYEPAMKRAAKHARKLRKALLDLEAIEINIRVVRDHG
ncbi:hypothetical protein [Microbacterium maritypicum]|uniref:hypothetical protein n=1 Tax=Microbacterium maritypicum TaxID=33918 RepID=UPI003A949509